MVYPARRVVTMNPALPSSEALAVADGHVLGVGTVGDLGRWGSHRIDDRFAEHVLMPGFIEAHCHVISGGLWSFTYVGFFDRRDPAGRLWPGCKSIDHVLQRLGHAAAEMTDDSRTLLAWGLDPIYFEGERLVARHLDTVTGDRPTFVLHASAHLATVNSALMARCGIDASSTSPGVARGDDGSPNGELHEPSAMMLAGEAYAEIMGAGGTERALWRFAAEARNAGHTLVADLGTTQLWDEAQLRNWRKATSSPSYPARVMLAVSNLFGAAAQPAELAELCVRLNAEQTDKLRFGIVKLILDGSIQGFTARVSWPGYCKPPPGHTGSGQWLIPPEQVVDLVETYHRAGLGVHCHCNGDEAVEVFIDAVETVLARWPRWDHRHTVQHCQMATPAQYRRMVALGLGASIFSNHVYYWGDQHREITVGPERAAGMNACATALSAGVSLSIHSDSPITPLGHLQTAWCAVNRVTASGELLGPDERIAVIVNDFGETSIDEDLIAASAGDKLTLANGCICCSLVDGFAAALRAVLSAESPPDRLLIEASDVADPAQVAAYGHTPGLRLDAVVAVADAERLERLVDDRWVSDIVRRQLAAADLLIVNKVDLLPAPERTAELCRRLRPLAPAAALVTASYAAVPTAVILDSPIGGNESEHSRPPTTGLEAAAAAGHAADLFESQTVRLENPVPAELIAALLAELPEGVTRLKGLVRLEPPASATAGPAGMGDCVIEAVGSRTSLTPSDPHRRWAVSLVARKHTLPPDWLARYLIGPPAA